MMEAVLQDLLGKAFAVESAGVREGAAGVGANPLSIQCMASRGIDISNHVSRWVGNLDLNSYSHIVCVGEDEANVVRSYLARNRERVIFPNNCEGIADPFGEGIEGYRNCLAYIDLAMADVSEVIRAVST